MLKAKPIFQSTHPVRSETAGSYSRSSFVFALITSNSFSAIDPGRTGGCAVRPRRPLDGAVIALTQPSVFHLRHHSFPDISSPAPPLFKRRGEVPCALRTPLIAFLQQSPRQRVENKRCPYIFKRAAVGKAAKASICFHYDCPNHILLFSRRNPGECEVRIAFQFFVGHDFCESGVRRGQGHRSVVVTRDSAR